MCICMRMPCVVGCVCVFVCVCARACVCVWHACNGDVAAVMVVQGVDAGGGELLHCRAPAYVHFCTCPQRTTKPSQLDKGTNG